MGQYLQQRGFAVGAVLLAIVLMAVVAGAIALGNRGSNANSAEQTARVNAATIIQESTNLRQGFDIMLARGTTVSTITFDATVNSGLFNPNTGGAQPQTIPGSAQITPSPWVYKAATLKVRGVGTDSGGDYAVVAVGIKDTVCQQIMQSLYNSSTLPASAVAESSWGTAGTLVDLSAGIVGIDNRPEGCVTTTDGTDHNVYYSVAVAQ